jgi:hypothetical protein
MGYRIATARRASLLAEQTSTDGGEEGSGGMRTITLEAATPDSGRALYSALSSFYPDFETDDGGTCFVSVSFSNEKQMFAVLDSIQDHLVGQRSTIANWVTIAAPDSLSAPTLLAARRT